MKKSLMSIRKNGKNYLVNVGNCDVIMFIDDMDLGS